MKLSRRNAIALLASGVLATPVFADSKIMSAPDALKAAREKKLFLVDIRTPGEWLETGIASPAHKISMHQRGFLQKLDKLIGGDKTKKIALICATGSRSAYIQSELAKRGYSNTISVAEGMLGGPNGKGWIPRGLPVTKLGVKN